MERTDIVDAVRRQTSLTTSDVSDADVFDIINEGINEVSGIARWPFLEKRSTLSVTASTEEVTLPADFMFMGLVQQVNKGNGPLVQLSFEEYSYRFGDNATTSDSARYFYLRFDDGTQKIGFYPTPASTATDEYEIFYFKKPTELSAADSTPEWDSVLHNILVDYTSYRLWEREEYFQESENAFRRYQRRLGDMMRFYKMRDKKNRFIVGDGSYYRGWRNIRMHYGFE